MVTFFGGRMGVCCVPGSEDLAMADISEEGKSGKIMFVKKKVNE